LTKLN